jgi:hypothetical protein
MVWFVEANVSEKRAASIFRAERGDNPHDDWTQKNVIWIDIAVKNLKSHSLDLLNEFIKCTFYTICHMELNFKKIYIILIMLLKKL